MTAGSAPPYGSGSVHASRKLCLIVVDSLRTDMLLRAVAEDLAPNFAALIERGTLIGDCVSAFPSVTPVACSEIATGASPERHHISGMNWYHRAEERYVEYGSSLEATRAFGLFKTLYDTVYNMNMAHLSHEVETVFERLGDAGVRTACTPFLIYRGRRRHELELEGVLRRVALAANFRHAVWGPDELFYGELYASRRVPCKPTLARPGTRDAYSACVARELIDDDGYDFLLFSLPDNDHHTHTNGVAAMPNSIAHADHCFGEIVDAAGGMDAFCDAHAVILVADHAQTDVGSPVPIAAALGERWAVLEPNAQRPELAELAVSPTARAAGLYLLREDERRGRKLTRTVVRSSRARGGGLGRQAVRCERRRPGGDRRECARGAPLSPGLPGRRSARHGVGSRRTPRRARNGAHGRKARERGLPGRPREALVRPSGAECR